MNIDKPSGMTSHDVVKRIRRSLKLKKVGHAGTLDPMAVGVLVICVGQATRLSEYAMQSTKTYHAIVRLGVETDTYDAEGRVSARHDARHITLQDVEQAVRNYVGEIDQIPPMYSAIKKRGKKLYELARSGQTVERLARRILIDSIDIVDWNPPQFTMNVVCGAGTYIRSLAYDIGHQLGVGAHLTGLTRTASGAFRLESAQQLDTITQSDDWAQFLLPIDLVVQHLVEVHVRAEDVIRVQQGQFLQGYEVTAELARAYAPDKQFIALLKRRDGQWQPYKVFI